MKSLNNSNHDSVAIIESRSRKPSSADRSVKLQARNRPQDRISGYTRVNIKQAWKALCASGLWVVNDATERLVAEFILCMNIEGRWHCSVSYLAARAGLKVRYGLKIMHQMDSREMKDGGVLEKLPSGKFTLKVNYLMKVKRSYDEKMSEKSPVEDDRIDGGSGTSSAPAEIAPRAESAANPLIDMARQLPDTNSNPPTYTDEVNKGGESRGSRLVEEIAPSARRFGRCKNTGDSDDDHFPLVRHVCKRKPLGDSPSPTCKMEDLASHPEIVGEPASSDCESPLSEENLELLDGYRELLPEAVEAAERYVSVDAWRKDQPELPGYDTVEAFRSLKAMGVGPLEKSDFDIRLEVEHEDADLTCPVVRASFARRSRATRAEKAGGSVHPSPAEFKTNEPGAHSVLTGIWRHAWRELAGIEVELTGQSTAALGLAYIRSGHFGLECTKHFRGFVRYKIARVWACDPNRAHPRFLLYDMEKHIRSSRSHGRSYGLPGPTN